MMTITEIAEKAGVSIGTVDRVLHNRGHVSAEKKQLVESIIKEYGYHPNPIAKHLKMNKNFVIGILIPYLNSESGYWNMIYGGIQKAIDELNPFSVSAVLAEFDRSASGDFLRAAYSLIQKKIDALIIAPVNQKESVQFLHAKISIPYVFIDSLLPNMHPLAAVAQNPFYSGFCAARMMSLLRPNAQKLVTVQVYRDTYNLAERARGFASFYNEQSFQKQQNVPQLIELIGTSPSVLHDIFKNHKNIDGFFVTNDSVHILAEEIRMAGVMPRPAIIGYDLLDHNRASLLNDCIDCIISQAPEQQGYDAVHSIYKKELLLQETAETVAVPIQVYIKESLGGR